MTERSSSQDWQQQGIEHRFINESELEALTGISKRTWQKHRLFGRGPKFYRLCGAIRYYLPEVFEWINRQSVDGGRTA